MSDDGTPADTKEEVDDLVLESCRLVCREGWLLRRDADGRVLAKVPLVEIEHIGVVRRLEFLGVLTVAIGLIVAAVGYSYREDRTLSIISYVVATLVVAVGLLVCVSQLIRIDTADGCLYVRIDGDIDDARSFVTSVRREVREARGNPDADD